MTAVIITSHSLYLDISLALVFFRSTSSLGAKDNCRTINSPPRSPHIPQDVTQSYLSGGKKGNRSFGPIKYAEIIRYRMQHSELKILWLFFFF